jgi:peptidyl-prolyl cis-trans isomerase SurA
MTDTRDSSSLHLLTGWGWRGAAALAVMAAIATGAHAQTVVAFVNGEPITSLDVDQRAKLDELGNHKTAVRKDVIEELIDERLKIREGKRWSLEPTNAEVDNAYATMAERVHTTPDGLTQQLTKVGSSANALKSRIRADIIWQSLVRGRYAASLEINDKDVLAEMIAKKTDSEPSDSFEYTLRPVLFLIPPGSPESVYEERKRDAEALRGRFQNCDTGLPLARSLASVIVRDKIVRHSADVPAELRKGLDAIPVGQLTAPDITKLGIEMFAICGKKPDSEDKSPSKKQARDAAFQERFEKQSKQYLDSLRSTALIEYK